MDIPYDYYKTFYYAAECGSLSRAALMLGRGQPNVTKTIGNLEELLGCQLFVRTARGVRMTPEGEHLHAHVKLAVEQLLAAERELAMDQSLQSGTVTIASSEIALRCCLLPVLEKYRQLYPGVRIRVTNFSTPQAIEAVKSSRADLAVVTMPPGYVTALRERELSQLQEVLIGGRAFRLLQGRRLSVAELSEHPFICLNTETSTYPFLIRFFAEHGGELRPDIEVATAGQIVPMVKSNLGLGLVPRELIPQEEYENGIYLLEMEEPLPKKRVCLLQHEGHPVSVAAKKLMEMLLEQAQQQAIKAGEP